MVKKKTAVKKVTKKKSAAKKITKKKTTKKKAAVKKTTREKTIKKTAAKKTSKKVTKKPIKKKSPFAKKELAVIKQELLEKKAQILEDFVNIEGETLKSAKDASGDLSGYSFHMADMATDLYDREFMMGLAEGERERLFALDDAIKRVDEGVYGACDLCGENIPKQRLKAVPQAQFCIKCQEKEEKTAG